MWWAGRVGQRRRQQHPTERREEGTDEEDEVLLGSILLCSPPLNDDVTAHRANRATAACHLITWPIGFLFLFVLVPVLFLGLLHSYSTLVPLLFPFLSFPCSQRTVGY